MPEDEKKSHDGCEWHPLFDRPSYEDERHFIKNEATVLVGANGNYRLCSDCAALPRFKRFKKQPIRPPADTGQRD